MNRHLVQTKPVFEDLWSFGLLELLWLLNRHYDCILNMFTDQRGVQLMTSSAANVDDELV